MKFTYKRILYIIFIIIEIILYSGFLYIDITGNGSYNISSSLKFSGIILCFLFTLIIPYSTEDRIDNNILRTALLFTVISDLFILIFDYYIIGLVTFCIVQSLYLIRLGIWKNRMDLTVGMRKIINKFIRNFMISFGIILILIVLNIKIEWLILISCFYFISIVFNVSDSVAIARKSKVTNKVIYAVGMILFLLCDINVGFFNLSDFLSIDSNWFTALYHFSTVAMWMFYLPAQVIIALSGQAGNKTE